MRHAMRPAVLSVTGHAEDEAEEKEEEEKGAREDGVLGGDGGVT